MKKIPRRETLAVETRDVSYRNGVVTFHMFVCVPDQTISGGIRREKIELSIKVKR